MTALGGFHSHGGTPIAGWFRENPIYKWMMTGGSLKETTRCEKQELHPVAVGTEGRRGCPGREQIGVHTCDRRSSRTDYVESFPKVDVSYVKHDEERIRVLESRTCSSNNMQQNGSGRHIEVW